MVDYFLKNNVINYQGNHLSDEFSYIFSIYKINRNLKIIFYKPYLLRPTFTKTAIYSIPPLEDFCIMQV